MGRGRAASSVAVLALASVLVLAASATGSHVRPKGATPLRLSLVPAYKECTPPNRTHGAPLSFPSCNPPRQVSDFVTVGTPDANGAGANSIAYVQVDAIPGDIHVKINVNDLRCRPATASAVCQSANAADGPDYAGKLRGYVRPIKITDHDDGSALNEAGTVVDIPSPFVEPTCANTASTLVGGTCTIDTTVNAVTPGAVKDGKRTIWEFGRFEVHDGGPDGNPMTEPDLALLLAPGVFVP